MLNTGKIDGLIKYLIKNQTLNIIQQTDTPLKIIALKQFNR